MLPTVYKAARLNPGRNVTLETLKFPALNTKQLIIKPDIMGICRADVKEVDSARDIVQASGPLFGHELIGRVVYQGDTEYAEGSLITFNPNVVATRTTGFAEYFFIEGNNQDLKEGVIPVPDDVSVDPRWLPEPFACIVHSFDKFMGQRGWTDLQGKKIGILGLGNSGTEFGLMARFHGGEVTLFNRNRERIDFTLTNQLFNESAVRPLSESERFAGFFDALFVAPTVMDDDILRISQRLVRERGSIHLYGGTRKGMKFLKTDVDIDAIRRGELYQPFRYGEKNLFLSGAYGCRRADFEKGFQLYRDNPEYFPLARLVSTTITLEELPSVLMGMARGESDFPGKVLIKNE